MATLEIIITQDAAKGTTEFKRILSADIREAKVLDSCFEVCWNRVLDENVFDVYAGNEHFVIHYREVNKTTYPSQQAYYDYLKSLSVCAQDLSSLIMAMKDGEYTVFCDPNDNDRLVALIADLTDPLVPIFTHFYIDTGLIYGGAVNDLEPCLPARMTETLICSNGITLKQRTYVDGLGNNTYLYFGSNGAPALPPTTYTQGACGIVNLNVDGLVPIEGPKQAITTGDNAQDISPVAPKRESLIIQVFDFDVWVRLKDAATDPTLRVSYFVKAGGEFSLSAFANGQKYIDEVSIINAVNGQVPTFSFTELRRP